MRYLNKVFLSLCFFIFSPVLAYNSGDDIVITRKAPQQKALLDRKFIFMQHTSSLAKDSQLTTGKLNALTPRVPVAVAKPLVSKPKPAVVSESWDNYAEEVEMEESLEVGAKLLGIDQ